MSENETNGNTQEKKEMPVKIDYQPDNIENEMLTAKAISFSQFFNLRTLNIFLGTKYLAASKKGSICNSFAMSIDPAHPSFTDTDPHILKGSVTKLMTDECSLLWALYQASTLKSPYMEKVNHINLFTSSLVLFNHYNDVFKTIFAAKNGGDLNEIEKMLNDQRRSVRSCRIIKATAEIKFNVNFYYVEKLIPCPEERFKTMFYDVNGIKLNYWDFKSISAGVIFSAQSTRSFAFTNKDAL